MDVKGTGKKPIINLSSQPQLSEPDIISLLALGVTATDLAGQDSGSEGQVIEMGTQILFNQTGILRALLVYVFLLFSLPLPT